MFSGVPILKEFLGYTAGLVCPESDDGYHHASSYEVDRESGYYNCICDVCGWPFLAYETDLQQAYETQVSELPATGVTSSGGLLYNPCDYPEFTSVSLVYPLNGMYYTKFYLLSDCPWSESSVTSPFSMTCSSVSDSHSHINCVFSFNTPANMFNIVRLEYSAPISGIYTLKSAGSLVGYYINSSNSRVSLIDSKVSSVSSGSFYSGDSFPTFYFNVTADNSSLPDAIYAEIDYYPPIYEITPFDSEILNTYTINSRPTSFVGNYGIIGDNGQITQVDNSSIVNETNNTYTNPCTGTTSTITEWTYDYSDRSYNVTTESGDTVTITYGDENITIQEGDTVYNVYYMVDEDPGGEPGVDPSESSAPETCQHKYTAVTDREATCTFAGQVTYTCSLCGHSYTESIPATGHAWDIKETVQTSYDEEGNLLQQGYTIYKCSVCGEEYKDETGTGPPGSGDGSGSGSGEEGESIWDKLGNLIGTILGTIIDIISAVIGKILDALLALVEMIGDKLVAVVDLVLSFFDEIPRLFSGFLAFLTAVFPFLPEEVMLLLTFGIAVIVFIGIIKALRR